MFQRIRYVLNYLLLYFLPAEREEGRCLNIFKCCAGDPDTISKVPERKDINDLAAKEQLQLLNLM